MFKVSNFLVALMVIPCSHKSVAEEIFFNPNALEIDSPTTNSMDLSLFSSRGYQLPGRYTVDVYINGELKDSMLEMNFVSDEAGSLSPEISLAQLKEWGVQVNSSAKLIGVPDKNTITDLPHYFPMSSTNFDFSRQILKVSVPQAYVNEFSRNETSPDLWDDGIPSLILDYNFVGAQNHGYSDSYLNLRSGANFGGWRLRNYSVWNNTDDNKKLDSINTYAQHDLQSIKGQFIAGDRYTSSEVFESLQFRGIQVMSDEKMLPENQRGFAPTVKGIANSNAQVSIRQNGSLIYQVYVPPGAFIIDDLYPTSFGGDLDVTITESDGSTRSFKQPFSSLPFMLREDRFKYGLTIGQYRTSNNNGVEPFFLQETLAYGLSNNITVNGGFQLSSINDVFSIGVGLNLGNFGSFSLDTSQAITSIDNIENSSIHFSGQSYQFRYSKHIDTTNATFTLVGQRYATNGFFTFKEAADYYDYNNGSFVSRYKNKRSRLNVNYSQSLMDGKWGSISFSGYQQDYWEEKGYERNFTFGYHHSIFNDINLNLTYTYTDNLNQDISNEQQLLVNLSMPLSLKKANAYIGTNLSNDLHGNMYSNMVLSGTALEDNNLSYSLNQSLVNHNENNISSINGRYKGTYGEIDAGYSNNGGHHRFNYGVKGAMILHDKGLTFGHSIPGEMSAVALIEAPEASNVKVKNNNGVRTDWRGYTIVPYLTPYTSTRLSLEPESLQSDVELEGNTKTVIPSAGAVVRAKYNTSVGNRVLMTLKYGDHFVPFGAIASINENTKKTSIVGDEGNLYLSGVPEKGSLKVKWGSSDTQKCLATFNLSTAIKPSNNIASGVKQITISCI
ncbi:TPA: fimbrial biogenesis outer membrane usher protein [Vibrio campbellii]|nr:fimbrial biogenesis outer membrane usher protein [Vibrio campbellii]